MKSNPTLLFALSCIILLSQIRCASHSTGGSARPDSVVYKQTPQGDLKLYFHYPEGWSASDKQALIVFFFGGGWVNGTTEQFRYQAEYLAGRGMVTVRAEYRVKNRHGTGVDQCVEDGKSAVRWLRQNASGLGVDPEKIIAAGGSAGGHIAVCTQVVTGLEADGEDLSVSSKPNLLVLFNPVMNTATERFVERFGSEELATTVSPNTHLDGEVPPAIMFFGSEDKLIEGAFETLELASGKGFDIRLWVADGMAHGFFNHSPWRESTIFLTDRFLTEFGFLEGDPDIEMPENGPMKMQ